MDRSVFGLVAAAAIAFGLVGCSSEDSSSSASKSCKIEGAYSVTQKRTAGTCAPFTGEGDPTTLTFIVNGNTADMSQQGVTGSCPGKIDGCTATFVCEYQDDKGNVIGTENTTYKFTNNGFTGSAAISVRPPVVPAICTADYAVTGTRK